LIRKATAQDLPAIGRTLAAAFEQDPVTVWYWRRPDRRHEHLATWFSLIARLHYLPHGQVFVAEEAGEVAGCSMWAAPRAWRLSGRDELRLTREIVPRLGLRLPLATIAMRRMERRHPDEPHWYLSTLGVRPASQGRGLGSQLMFDMLGRCDTEGTPAYLESSTEESRALYERHGFETREVLGLPRGGPPLWLMWRDPGHTKAARAV
jgi:ribosomal protein S18 acetylase RimI-like enzyme